MREYHVTTNTDLAIIVPTLTVTVRCALFVPARCLPAEDAGEPRGRETWVGGPSHLVLPTFEVSEKPLGKGPITLAPVVGLDGEPIKAKRVVRSSGVACTDVRYSSVLDRGGLERALGEARLPLFGIERGDYLLRIVPPPEETTRPDAPAGPDTVVRGVLRAFRPLLVRLSFDDDLDLISAVTCTLRDGVVSSTDLFSVGAEVSRLPVNHGYVTAFAADDLAIDMKPDVLQADQLEQTPSPETHVRRDAIDMVVIHATDGLLMGSPVNTALQMQFKKVQQRIDGVLQFKKEKGKDVPVMVDALDPQTGARIIDDGETCLPHYEVDRDGHVVKFVPDDFIVYQAGPSHFYRADEAKYVTNVNARSIGIEVTHRPGTSYPEQQTVGLLALLSRLAASYAIKPEHFVGHVDTLVKAGVMDDARIRCPSRDLDWPRLEAAGFGRKTVSKTLSDADYGGFFMLTIEELQAAQAPRKAPRPEPTPLPPALRLQDSDNERIWGGVRWRDKPASEVPRARRSTFAGIVAELHGDLEIMGYSVDDHGVFNDKTDRAVAHFIAHTFSGSRRHGGLADIRLAAEAALQLNLQLAAALGVPAEPVDPLWVLHEDIPTDLKRGVFVTRLVASFIKGTADAIRGGG